jgi:hypothetical protein
VMAVVEAAVGAWGCVVESWCASKASKRGTAEGWTSIVTSEGRAGVAERALWPTRTRERWRPATTEGMLSNGCDGRVTTCTAQGKLAIVHHVNNMWAVKAAGGQCVLERRVNMVLATCGGLGFRVQGLGLNPKP